MELRVIVGPSGSGKRTRMGFLQDLFGFMTVTGVRPTHLTPAVQNVVSLEGSDVRLVVEMPTIHFSARPFNVQSETFVEHCMGAFGELKQSFPQADLSIIFQYCSQQELAKRLVHGFHPLMHTVGNLQAAIFAECTTHVQLFKRLCKAYDAGVFAHQELIFSDRTGKTADQLKDEISQRRYLKHPDDPDTDTRGVSEAVGRENDKRRKVKETLEAISRALDDAENERARKSKSLTSLTGDETSMLRFISRGWNTMQATILDMAKAQSLVHTKPHLNCLLVGESGTGKEAIAAFLHYCRPERDRGEFVTVDCTAIPEHLLESELFGHEKGAFTHADRARPGILRRAVNGTVFFDEIDLMPISLQAKLLRFLETRRFRSVGSDESVGVPNCRVVAATSRNLDEAVQKETFLVDLYNRLRAVTITVPPLRERREDILYLLEKLVPHVVFKPGAEALLFDYHWGGNVRELRSVVERYESANGDSDSRGPRNPTAVGVSTLLEDWPGSVARGYLEGAMKWRWPMREQTKQGRLRIFHEVQRELEHDQQPANQTGDNMFVPTSSPPERPVEIIATMASAPQDGAVRDGEISADEFRHLYKTIVMAGRFTPDDDKAFWKQLARDAVHAHGGNKRAAADMLKVPRSTLYSLLKDTDDEDGETDAESAH